MDGLGVLGGEDFGGCHEGGLVAGFGGNEGGKSGDEGFATADITLEEAIHGGGLIEVLDNLPGDTTLGVGEFEGEAGNDLLQLGELVWDDGAGELLILRAIEFAGEQECKQFFICQICPTLLGVGGGGGKVNFVK